MRQAFIVWNEEKTEGVIFVQEPLEPGCHTAMQDALYAADISERKASVTSALAERWRELYDEGGCSVVETTAEILLDL